MYQNILHPYVHEYSNFMTQLIQFGGMQINQNVVPKSVEMGSCSAFFIVPLCALRVLIMHFAVHLDQYWLIIYDFTLFTNADLDVSRWISKGRFIKVDMPLHIKLWFISLLWCFCMFGKFLCHVEYLCVFSPPQRLNSCTMGAGRSLIDILSYTSPAVPYLKASIYSAS